MDEILLSLTEAAGRFKLQGTCFAGNRYISGGQSDVIGLWCASWLGRLILRLFPCQPSTSQRVFDLTNKLVKFFGCFALSAGDKCSLGI